MASLSAGKALLTFSLTDGLHVCQCTHEWSWGHDFARFRNSSSQTGASQMVILICKMLLILTNNAPFVQIAVYLQNKMADCVLMDEVWISGNACLHWILSSR